MWASDPIRRVAVMGALAAALLATGCVEVALREGSAEIDYELYEPMVLPTPAEGAIWPGDTPSGSFLFFDRKARSVGDLVTVLIEEEMSAEGTASTSLESTRSIETTLLSDIGLFSIVTAPIRGLLKLLGAKGVGAAPQAGDNINVLSANNETEFDGDGTVSRAGRFEGRMTCRIVGLLQSGVMHIRGRRYVVVNHEAQYVSIEGLIRPEDIGIDNTIRSTQIADARISYDGLGVVDDKQRPGVIARVWDWVYPF